MGVVEVLPRLHMFRFRIGQAYLWRDGADLALIDAGDIDAAPAIEGAVRGPGLNPARIGRIVIAHGHCDHYGAAQELADRHGAEILAHGPDAAVIRGEEAVAPRVPHRDPSSRHGVLFTGDTVARVDRVIPGVLNIDRAQTVASFRRPGAGAGHGLLRARRTADRGLRGTDARLSRPGRPPPD